MALLCQINKPTQAPIPFRMVDATDGTTEEPGLTPTVYVKTPGSNTYTVGAGGVTEIAYGDYEYAPATVEVNAYGVLLTRATGTGAMNARGVPVQVVGFDPTANIQNPDGGSTTLSAAGVTAVQSGMATTAHLQEVEDKVDTLDTVADAIKAKTDSLTFTVAGVLNAGIYYINGVALIGDGSAGDKFRV